MKFTKEVKTALLAVVAILLLIFGYSFLKGQNLLDSHRTFYAIYEDVEGLAPSSTVTINGLRVGQVTDIDFLNQSGDLIVTFTVEKDFEFSKSSTAQIYGGDIIGGKSVAIVPEYEEGELAQSGDTLNSAVEEGIMELVNERLRPLQEKIEGAVVSTDSLITSFNEILNDTTRDNLRNTFRELNTTITSFRGTAQSLEGIVQGNSGKLDRTFTNLDEMSTNFNNFSDTLSQINLNQMTADLEKVISDLEGVSNKLNNGDGTAGKLLNDETAYNNLEDATRQLEELLRDVKLNPRRYVHFSIFGKNPGPYQPQDTIN